MTKAIKKPIKKKTGFLEREWKRQRNYDKMKTTSQEASEQAFGE